MGGHGGLNILPQKKWNVYNYENREIVKKDEEMDRLKKREIEKKVMKEEAEQRMVLLRKRKYGEQEEKDNVEERKMLKSTNFFEDYEKTDKIEYDKNIDYQKDQELIKRKNEKFITKYLGDGAAELLSDDKKPFYLKPICSQDYDLTSFLASKQNNVKISNYKEPETSCIARPGTKSIYSSGEFKESSVYINEKQNNQKDLLDPMNIMKEMLAKKKALSSQLKNTQLQYEQEKLHKEKMQKENNSHSKSSHHSDKEIHHHHSDKERHRSDKKHHYSDKDRSSKHESRNSKESNLKSINDLRQERLNRENLEREKSANLLQTPIWAKQSIDTSANKAPEITTKYHQGFQSWAMKDIKK